MDQSKFDILVVGAGLAGLKAAFTVAEKGQRVLLITSSFLCSGSSFYPLMESLHCLCTADEEDKEDFILDITENSYGMNDPYMSRYYIDNIKDCIDELSSMGMVYEKLPERKLACFAHRTRDLYYWKDWKAQRRSVSEKLDGIELISIMEHTDLSCILTKEDRVAGAVLYNNGNMKTIEVKSIILASGGFGNLYLHNLNTADVDGSSHALALKVGAKLINMEFNQFIPGFISPVYKIILREGTLRHCTGLYDHSGQDILKKMLPDEKDYENCLKLREPHGPFTTADSSKYFDIALMEAALSNIKASGDKIDKTIGTVISYSPSVLSDPRIYVKEHIEWLEEEHGLDIFEDTITIAPFFHAANGGIYVDHSCSTGVAGLYACGEVAGGIHGADRLGGMASGSCLVFGRLAGESASDYVEDVEDIRLGEEEVQKQLSDTYRALSPFSDGSVKTSQTIKTPKEVCKRVRELMWQHGNIIRTEENLRLAIYEIDQMAHALNEQDLFNRSNRDNVSQVMKAYRYVDLSRCILKSMLERRESRGGHYRKDYPKINDKDYRRRTLVYQKEGQSCFTTE